jgi:hypothetical protein
MMHQLRDRLTYSNVMATVAVFVALGGTSYAAITLPRNSVGANQIRSNAVRASEVRDRSLATRDLSVAARNFLKGQRGPRGLTGPPGPAGTTRVVNERGETVTTNLSVTHVANSEGTIGPESVTSLTAQCPSSTRVLGGGMRVDSGSDVSMRESYPNLNNTAWTARVGNDHVSEVGRYTVFAICAPTS